MATDVNYLGFAGHGNLGDDAIFEVYRRELPEVTLWPVPVRKAHVARRLVDGSIARHRGGSILLGGGTVLGRTLWRHHIDRTRMMLRPSAWAMMGAGVEDPDFAGDHSYTSREEIRSWRRTLESFGEVTVRGPRSQEILAEAGIASRIVGDPALLLGTEVAPPSVAEMSVRPVLVNLTAGEDQWGGRGNDWIDHAITALRRLRDSGFAIEFVSMEHGDIACNARAIAALDGAPHHMPRDTEELERLLASARLVIGTRLHACVVAVAVGVPTLSLEYRPKCRDFMASVDIEERCLRVDRMAGATLVDAAMSLDHDRDAVLRTQAHAVERHRVALRESIQALRSSLLREGRR